MKLGDAGPCGGDFSQHLQLAAVMANHGPQKFQDSALPVAAASCCSLQAAPIVPETSLAPGHGNRGSSRIELELLVGSEQSGLRT